MSVQLSPIIDTCMFAGFYLELLFWRGSERVEYTACLGYFCTMYIPIRYGLHI